VKIPPVVTKLDTTRPARAPAGSSARVSSLDSFFDAQAIRPAPIASPNDSMALDADDGSGARSGSGRDDGGAGRGGSGQGSGNSTPATTFLTARWVVEPGARELEGYYPREARRNGTGGIVTLACQVRRSYRLKRCYVLSELPAGQGFGPGVLRASQSFRVYPPKQDGEVLEQAWVAVTITMAVRGSER
jgi:hypothetical protein